MFQTLKLFQKTVNLTQRNQARFFDFLKNSAFDKQNEQQDSKKEQWSNRKEDFKSKQEEEHEKEAEYYQSVKETEYETKEQFIKALREERQEKERERELSKESWAELDQRMRREQEVKFAQVDFNKLMMQNINVIPVESFKHPDQLFYFINNLPVQVSEENVVKCIDGFLSLADDIEQDIIESSTFSNFVGLVENSLQIASEEQTFVRIGQFADLYCISDSVFWEKLERKIIQKINKLEPDTIINVLGSFSNQKEGSDYFYQQVSQVVSHYIDYPEEHKSLPTFSNYVLVAQSFFRMKAGTLDFFEKVQSELMGNIKSATLEDVIKLSYIFQKIKKHKEEIFELLEDRVWDFLEQEELRKETNYSLFCLAGEAFGFEMGSNEMFEEISKIGLENIKDCNTKQELDIFLKGFLFSYRGNKEILKVISKKIENIINEQTAYYQQNVANKQTMDELSEHYYSVTELARIHKAFYIAEYSDKQFEFILEQFVLSQIKDVSRITVEELAECVKSYTITRQGSRQIYKLLELVIKHKFQEIKQNHQAAEDLYVYYAKSGLCTPELLEQLELMM